MEWKKEITANRKKKQIEIVCGDILNVANEYDLLVCSAFKGDYAAFPGTLIGNLSKEGISVESEAEHAEIDCRKSKNYWVSQPLNNKFGRLGCIELLGIIELVYIVLQSVVKPGITGFFKIDLHIKCYIYLS